MNEWMASSQLMITKPGGITISEGLTRSIPMIFLNPAPGQELENAYYFQEKGYGRIADTPEDAIDIVSELTHDSNKLTLMINTMRQDRVDYSTHRLCIDLLNMPRSFISTARNLWKGAIICQVLCQTIKA